MWRRRVYYNDNDEFACNWLCELMHEGLIPEGDIDQRSIRDVSARDLRGYTQCHFFAGIGGWAYALELAGWGEREVWTGSCPCQPFSAAGKGAGFDDARHLWPDFARLIGECKPPVLFGEQVASKLGREWLARVRADLEGVGYACGAADLCAAGVAAPHIRQRLFWMADRLRSRTGYTSRESLGAEATPDDDDRSVSRERLWLGVEGAVSGVADCQRDARESRRLTSFGGGDAAPGAGAHVEFRRRSVSSKRLAYGSSSRRGGQPDRDGRYEHDGAQAGWEQSVGVVEQRGASDGLAHGDGRDACAERLQRSGEYRQQQTDGCLNQRLQQSEGDGRVERWAEPGERSTERGRTESRVGDDGDAGLERWGLSERERRSQRAAWTASVFIECADAKYRRIPTDEAGHIESRLFPLAHGVSNRVGTLRGAGNAIVPQVAAEFIKAYLDIS